MGNNQFVARKWLPSEVLLVVQQEYEIAAINRGYRHARRSMGHHASQYTVPQLIF